MFSAGAGRIGDYADCCWMTQGQGQFRPLAGSDPYQGSVGQVESVAEIKVELVCADDCIETVLEALIATHPYETPAYGAFKVYQLVPDA